MIEGSVLITGCSRGLGLEMVKQLTVRSGGSKFKPDRIVATCRNPDEASQLKELESKNSGLVIVKKLDVTDYGSFPNFFEEMKDLTTNSGLGLLINNAGYSPSLTRLSTVKVEQMMETFNINVVGPLMLVKTMLPLLKVAAINAKEKDDLMRKPIILNMSSILGSIGEPNQKGGGVYPYRASKAALNMVTKSLSRDLSSNGIDVVSIHPGWVKTALGGPNAPQEVEESVAGVLNVIEHFNRAEHNGEFLDYQGSRIPW